MSSDEPKLPPIDFREDIHKYEAFNEEKEVKLVKCPHKETKIVNGTLKCKCGGGWSGPTANLLELQRLLSG